MHTTISPRQLARAIGASESSVKRWCDRGVVPSVKTAGGHRRLPLSGVLAFLEQQGHPLVRPEELGLPPGIATHPAEGRESALRHFVRAMQEGNLAVCQRLVAETRLAGRSMAWICDELIAPSLMQIGDGWCRGSVEIFEERRGCEMVVLLLADLLRWLPPVDPAGPVAVGGTMAGDPYALPPRMVELVLRESGWNATSLGCGLPLTAFRAALQKLRPRLLWLSVSHLADAATFLREYNELWQEADSLGTAVAVGGCALTAEVRRQMNYSLYGDKLQHLVCFVQALRPESLPKPTGSQEPLS